MVVAELRESAFETAKSHPHQLAKFNNIRDRYSAIEFRSTQYRIQPEFSQKRAPRDEARFSIIEFGVFGVSESSAYTIYSSKAYWME